MNDRMQDNQIASDPEAQVAASIAAEISETQLTSFSRSPKIFANMVEIIERHLQHFAASRTRERDQVLKRLAELAGIAAGYQDYSIQDISPLLHARIEAMAGEIKGLREAIRGLLDAEMYCGCGGGKAPTTKYGDTAHSDRCPVVIAEEVLNSEPL